MESNGVPTILRQTEILCFQMNNPEYRLPIYQEDGVCPEVSGSTNNRHQCNADCNFPYCHKFKLLISVTGCCPVRVTGLVKLSSYRLSEPDQIRSGAFSHCLFHSRHLLFYRRKVDRAAAAASQLQGFALTFREPIPVSEPVF